jgi:hypothetical protein
MLHITPSNPVFTKNFCHIEPRTIPLIGTNVSNLREKLDDVFKTIGFMKLMYEYDDDVVVCDWIKDVEVYMIYYNFCKIIMRTTICTPFNDDKLWLEFTSMTGNIVEFSELYNNIIIKQLYLSDIVSQDSKIMINSNITIKTCIDGKHNKYFFDNKIDDDKVFVMISGIIDMIDSKCDDIEAEGLRGLLRCDVRMTTVHNLYPTFIINLIKKIDSSGNLYLIIKIIESYINQEIKLERTSIILLKEMLSLLQNKILDEHLTKLIKELVKKIE